MRKFAIGRKAIPPLSSSIRKRLFAHYLNSFQAVLDLSKFVKYLRLGHSLMISGGKNSWLFDSKISTRKSQVESSIGRLAVGAPLIEAIRTLSIMLKMLNQVIDS